MFEIEVFHQNEVVNPLILRITSKFGISTPKLTKTTYSRKFPRRVTIPPLPRLVYIFYSFHGSRNHCSNQEPSCTGCSLIRLHPHFRNISFFPQFMSMDLVSVCFCWLFIGHCLSIARGANKENGQLRNEENRELYRLSRGVRGM